MSSFSAAFNNPTWGQERVADELSLKLGILVSPRDEEVLAERSEFGLKRASSQALEQFANDTV